MRILGMMIGMILGGSLRAEEPWVVYPGPGPRVVMVSGDEEYRSEETLTQFGRILANRHGFHVTVLYAIDPADGTINPKISTNIPGLAALDSADLLVLFTRYRELPDDQMAPIARYIDSGKPIMGLRTATHAFANNKGSAFRRFGGHGPEWPGGFGRHVLGESWIDHHGHHGKQGTRGRIAPGQAHHPILRGVADGAIFGPSDVYTVRLPPDCTPLVLGEVTASLDPASPAVTGKKNDPMMPIAWTRNYVGASKKPSRVFTTTMGASQDFANPALRRMLVNAAYWALGKEDDIRADLSVEIVGEFQPSAFRFDGWRRGVKPSALALPVDR